jgi:hypothetical protein
MVWLNFQINLYGMSWLMKSVSILEKHWIKNFFLSSSSFFCWFTYRPCFRSRSFICSKCYNGTDLSWIECIFFAFGWYQWDYNSLWKWNYKIAITFISISCKLNISFNCLTTDQKNLTLQMLKSRNKLINFIIKINLN